ncbi:siderophore-interacting protein [Microbacterium sp. LRZ72]|uniref:siderophore-interacting protein n=1 Tax=Microbacterium sp. LRZ72 TaxID=2942481 RepID=UPI0029BC5B96|nr:siderophore-interacting protein [Microbacterium sp. LRZ72]MDX2376333.1 siderophore-interacting protein [Microbacterium sp. LRZ72]
MTDQTPSRVRRAPADDGRFAREGGRLRFTARHATVTAVSRPAPALVRVTFSGPDFADFESNGPTDHVRLFFPDPLTGELVAPSPVGPGEDGIVRPEQPSIARDFTPLAPRRGESGEVEVDVDFFVHPDPGPASSWGEHARRGDSLVMVGPRGSKRAPQDIDGLVLVVDETSLPAAARWVAEVPPATRIEILATVNDPGAWVADYLAAQTEQPFGLHLLAPDADGSNAVEALRALDIGEGTFVWAAGEAGTLVPIRRHLRRDLALPRGQALVSGYWRRGTTAFDHHSPVDPDDPD